MNESMHFVSGDWLAWNGFIKQEESRGKESESRARGF